MNCTELMVRFEKHDLKLVALEGERFMTIRYLALALETRLSTMKKLVREMRDRGELREGVHFRCTPFQTNGGNQLTTLITYRGVIRVAMRSDSPRAVRFRDWAEEVLYTLMTSDGDNTQGIRSLIEKGLKQIGTANQEAAKKACDLILSLRAGEPTTLPKVLQTSLRDRGYSTAVEWVKKFFPQYRFPSMNYGGRFEGYVARKYLAENGRWPEHDESKRLYAWLYSETRDRRFLETCLVEFLKDEVARATLKGMADSPKAITAGAEV